MKPDKQAVARLTSHLAKLLNGLSTDDARRSAHGYGAIAYEELIGVGFKPDDAANIIEGVLVEVFRRLELGNPEAL